MSEIADARARLHDQLVAYCDGALNAERIHLYSPTIVASPAVWIGQPGVYTLSSGSRGKVRAATFGVYIVPDGYEPAQCAWLDEMVARISDAIYNLPRADEGAATPRPIDIGGTSVRAVVFDVIVPVIAHSFCTRPFPIPATA